jgi:hypothetical protein
MRFSFTPSYDGILLNAIAIACFVCFHIYIDLPPIQELIFSTSDAQTYFDVSKWISDGTETDSTAIRPVLYPIFLLIIFKFSGEFGIFITQAILWLFTINLIFLSIKNLTSSILYAYVGSGIVLFNFSLMALTAHALTEIPSIFVLSLLTYLIILNRRTYREAKFALTVVVVLVALTLIKPIFYLPTMFTVFILIPIFYFKKVVLQPRYLLKLLVFLIPLFCQMSLTLVKHGEFKVSKIGSYTLSRYFIAQGLVQVEEIDFENARIKAEKLSTKERLTFLKTHLRTNYRNFTDNVKDNIKGAPTYLNFPIPGKNPNSTIFMLNYNKIMLPLHRFFFVLGILLVIQLWRQSNFELVIPIMILFVLNIYLIVMTGISFWQGDRLTLPAIALWAVLYPVLTHFALGQLMNKKNIIK